MASPPYELIADLPSPRQARERTVSWVADRSTMLLRRAARRRSILTEREPDVAHVHLLNLMTDGWSLPSVRRRVPLVTTVHDVRPHHRRLPEGVERLLLVRIYRHAGTIVVYHEYLRRQLVEHFDVDPRRVRVIPIPVRTYLPRRTERSGSEPPTVLLFGALRRNKGIDVLLDVAERLREADIRFCIAGRGAEEIEERVLNAARRLPNLRADIRFIPNSDRQRHYHAADLVVLPYTAFESQSGVLADAYSFGVPVLVTDVGALGDTVRQDGTGWVVPANDAAALAERIAELLDDDSARCAARLRMERIAGERSEVATGQAFRELYDEVAPT